MKRKTTIELLLGDLNILCNSVQLGYMTPYVTYLPFFLIFWPGLHSVFLVHKSHSVPAQ